MAAGFLRGLNRDARRLEQLTEETIRFIEELERVPSEIGAEERKSYCPTFELGLSRLDFAAS